VIASFADQLRPARGLVSPRLQLIVSGTVARLDAETAALHSTPTKRQPKPPATLNFWP
jgi:hypothetical protein